MSKHQFNGNKIKAITSQYNKISFNDILFTRKHMLQQKKDGLTVGCQVSAPHKVFYGMMKIKD